MDNRTLLGCEIPVGSYHGTGESVLVPDNKPRPYPVRIEVEHRRIITLWDDGDGEQVFDFVIRPFKHDTPRNLGSFCRLSVVKGFLRIPAGYGFCSGSRCQFSGAAFGQSFNIEYAWDGQVLVKTGVRHKRHSAYSTWREEVRLVS